MEKKLKKAISSLDAEKIESVFEQIYFRYSKMVGYIISKYVVNHQDTEDLVDEVFLTFSREMFRCEIRSIKYYLVTCGKNAAVNFVKRSSGREITYSESVEFGSSPPANQDTLFWDAVRQMCKILSPHEVDVVIQHTVFDHTFVELAQKYSCTVSAVSSTYQRAIKKVKKGDIL